MANESVNQYCMCQLNGIMDTLGKKWAVRILTSIGNKTVRYNDLFKELHSISPSTLSKILKDMNEMGILKREIFPEVPSRVEYSLTNMGKDLRSSILPLLKWAVKYGINEFVPNCCSKEQYVTVEL